MERPEDSRGQDPERGRPIGPDRERLEHGEIDLTGATRQDESLADVIGDAIVEAKARGGEIPEWGARAIARYLANQQSGDPTALHTFAATGRCDVKPVGDELAELWTAENTTPRSREWINWLGTYIVRLANDQGPPDAPAKIQEAIRERGPAFAAFLTLPDVTYENAIELFPDAYVGSYDSAADLVQDVIETIGLPALIDVGALEETARVDPERILLHAREVWDIVQHGGRYYLFDK